MKRKKSEKVFFLLIVIVIDATFTVKHCPGSTEFCATNRICRVLQCHTVFPELTPFGRLFKLGGYTMSKSSKPYEFPPPLAGMAQISYTDFKGLTSGVAPFD